MAKFYGVLLIIALVAVSGVIAYIGDIVGRRMGRKRLSLFGMRPRHTAIAISVVSGMLITIVTLGMAMLVSKNVRDGFLRVAQMRQQVTELQTEQNLLSHTVDVLQKRSHELEQERAKAKEEFAKQTTAYEAAKKSLATTEETLKAEQAKLAVAQQKVQTTELAVKRTTDDLLRTQATLRKAQLEVEKVTVRAAQLIAVDRMHPPVFEAGQQLGTVLIPSGLTLPQIRKQLESFTASLDASVRAAGARPGTGEARAVSIRHLPLHDKSGNVVTDAQGQFRWIPENEVLTSLASDIRAKGTQGGVVVRATSLVNARRGEQVLIDFEMFRNELVFARGTSLGSVSIEAGTSLGKAVESVYLMLKDKVFAPARTRIMPHTTPSSGAVIGETKNPVGGIGFQELIAAGERVKQIGGPARVTAVAREDAWTIGPLQVDLKVEPE